MRTGKGMDKIPIPDQDVVSIDSIAPGVIGLRVLIVNVYAISRSSGEWVLVDCGLPHSDGRIRRWAEEQFGRGVRPASIVLTHGHFDHTGSVEELAAEWNVPVYVHTLEHPYVTGKLAYAPPDPSVGGGLMALASRLYPRDPVDLGNRAQLLPEDGSIPGFPEWRWIHTPGHTVGHISLFRETDRTLIAGDAFVTTKQESLLAVATQRPELHGPPAYYTTDWDAARDSVERLAALRPAAVATGHGQPLAGSGVADALAALALNFDTVARPKHGRYVDKPAA
jgi:glyoxylase-like metal-dependent hydrolase (beta-lactamase superfamily II)